MLDIGDIDFVDETIDGFFESLPSHSLIFFARFIGDLGL